MSPYIELHARSAFSFLRGACVPEAYAADISADEKKWGGLVKKLGLKVE
jgi:DNA polymerase III alpha subunit